MGGRCRRAPGADLVHEPPQNLVLPFPLHQVSGPFRPVAGGDLVHETPQSLVPPLPLHQVSGHFRRGAGGDLVHETTQSLVLPFPLHQVSDSFRPAAGHVGAWLLYSTVRPRQHRRRFPGAGPTKLAPGSSQSLCLPSGHANTGAVFPARRRRLGPGRRGARRRKNKGLRVGAHHVRPAVGALAPEGVVLDDERIRDCGEGRTTSGPPSAPWTRKTWCLATKE